MTTANAALNSAVKASAWPKAALASSLRIGGKAISGAASESELDPYTRATVNALPSGEVVFAGPREDGFYADTPAIFDFLSPRIVDNDGDIGDGLGQDGGGVDGFKGYNVLGFAIQGRPWFSRVKLAPGMRSGPASK